MKHITTLSLILLVAVFGVTGFVFAEANGNNNGEVSMTPTDAQSNAWGTMQWKIRDRDGIVYADVYGKLHKLPYEPGWIYEVWLVDEESDTKLAVGTFKSTVRGNTIQFRSKVAVPNPLIYDKIVVTKEPMYDIDPTPHTPVLEGYIEDSIREVVEMRVLLKGRNEVPRSSSRATGHGTFMVNVVENTIDYNIVVHDLEHQETGAHLHGFAPEGENADVLYELEDGATKIGTIDYDESEEEMILAGLTYVNVHSYEFPSGEIRGQVMQVL